ncbi:MAG: Zn-ribbon domain-containing OB-fold protein [Nitrososphaerales archaeon]
MEVAPFIYSRGFRGAYICTSEQTESPKTNLTIKGFQEGIREGKIEGYVCKNCGHKQIDIIDFCPNCHGHDLVLTEFSREGRVLTYTIQFVAPEQFMNEVPYAWVVVELDGGPRVTGWIPFIQNSADLPVGQRVKFKKSYLPGIIFEKI